MVAQGLVEIRGTVACDDTGARDLEAKQFMPVALGEFGIRGGTFHIPESVFKLSYTRIEEAADGIVIMYSGNDRFRFRAKIAA